MNEATPTRVRTGGVKRLSAGLGYVWAAAAAPLILATFVGMNLWAGKLVAATGVKISPWYTGGEVERIIDHQTYQIRIHRPVFGALIGQRKIGFVQVDFIRNEGPGEGSTSLPQGIEEEIDLDGDGRADFRVSAETRPRTATVTALTPRVLGLEEVVEIDRGLAVRVRLRSRP